MFRQYFVLVDRRDSEKFRKFRMSEFNKYTHKILDKNNSRFVWSFHQAHVKETVWEKIKNNDYIFFSIPKNNFEVVGHISKKFIDKKSGKLMWPDSSNSDQITHFLLFDKLEKVQFLYNEMMSHIISKPPIPLPGIYEIKSKSQTILQLQLAKIFPEHQTNIMPKEFLELTITKSFTPKSRYEVNRFVRDSKLVQNLKKLYKNKCQICGFTFEYEKNRYYSEVHHYNPLEEKGEDSMDNMIVVCSNHHAKLDYKVIAIGLDGVSIINKDGKQIGSIYFKKDHMLNEKNLQSQLRVK